MMTHMNSNQVRKRLGFLTTNQYVLNICIR